MSTAVSGTTTLKAFPEVLRVGGNVTCMYHRAANNSDYDLIGLFRLGNDDNEAPDAFEYAAGKSDGRVTVAAPMAEGLWQFRYIKWDSKETLGTSNTIRTEGPACPNNCSNHGVCDMGACDCNGEWTGPDCSMGPGTVKIVAGTGSVVASSAFMVHWARPTNNSDSESDYIAMFPMDQTEDNLQDPVAFDYANTGRTMLQSTNNIAQVGDVTLTAPDTIGRYSLRYVRASRGDVIAIANVTIISGGCSTNCTNHGVCVDGNCKCALGWAGPDCADGDSETPCPSTKLNGQCNGHGECTRIKTKCAKYGICTTGTCVCDGGWSGNGCEEDSAVEARSTNYNEVRSSQLRRNKKQSRLLAEADLL